MRRKSMAVCCLLTIHLDLAEETKNRTHYQDLYFVVVFFFSSLKRKSNKNTIGFQAFTLAFISMVTHEGTSVFPLGIFSIKSFTLSSKRSQCQGRWFACVSMQLRAWLKQKKMVDNVFGVDAADLETKIH